MDQLMNSLPNMQMGLGYAILVIHIVLVYD